MVDFLIEFHPGERFRLHCIVSPADIPVSRLCWFLATPPEVFGHFADHWILAVYVERQIPEILMTILLVCFCLGFLGYALGGGEAGKSSYSESEERDYLELFISRS